MTKYFHIFPFSSGHLHSGDAWLAVRARVPECGCLHDARVPQAQVRGAEDQNVPRRAVSVTLYFHKNLCKFCFHKISKNRK